MVFVHELLFSMKPLVTATAILRSRSHFGQQTDRDMHEWNSDTRMKFCTRTRDFVMWDGATIENDDSNFPAQLCAATTTAFRLFLDGCTLVKP
jgi:hypothetical protein